jgi:hypothetical protein
MPTFVMIAVAYCSVGTVFVKDIPKVASRLTRSLRPESYNDTITAVNVAMAAATVPCADSAAKLH